MIKEQNRDHLPTEIPWFNTGQIMTMVAYLFYRTLALTMSIINAINHTHAHTLIAKIQSK